MTDEPINGTPPLREALCLAIPSCWERLWWRLGFRECHAYFDEEIEGFVPSYMTTVVYGYLDWKDRIRLLISGKIMVHAATKTDKPIDRAITRSVVSILPPNYKKIGRDGFNP